jgi:hypothetical protein
MIGHGAWEIRGTRKHSSSSSPVLLLHPYAERLAPLGVAQLAPSEAEGLALSEAEGLALSEAEGSRGAAPYPIPHFQLQSTIFSMSKTNKNPSWMG